MDNYKYLKYKQKYLNLKQLIGGYPSINTFIVIILENKIGITDGNLINGKIKVYSSNNRILQELYLDPQTLIYIYESNDNIIEQIRTLKLLLEQKYSLEQNPILLAYIQKLKEYLDTNTNGIINGTTNGIINGTTNGTTGSRENGHANIY